MPPELLNTLTFLHSTNLYCAKLSHISYFLSTFNDICDLHYHNSRTTVYKILNYTTQKKVTIPLIFIRRTTEIRVLATY